MNYYSLIVAGGIGRRMNATIPKQFLQLSGKPILMHTLFTFYNLPTISCQIFLVIPEEFESEWRSLQNLHQFNIPHQIVKGGEERFYSVRNGLDLMPNDGLVAIHDGVRPLVSNEVILKSFEIAKEKGNAIPSIPLKDSLRKINDKGNESVKRSDYRLIQTPQTFQLGLIKKAYQTPYSDTFTDDASVLEHYGERIHLIDGNIENIKITTPFDLNVANSLM